MTSYVGTKIYALEETNGFGSKCAQTSEIRKGGDHIVVNDEARFLREGTVRPYKYEAYSDDTALIDRLRENPLVGAFGIERVPVQSGDSGAGRRQGARGGSAGGALWH